MYHKGHSKRAVKNKFGSKKNLIREEIEDNV
nr:MAG TPA: NicR-crystal derepression, Nicotine regulator 2 [Caudoviricetes sp.]